ncbi:MAG: ABC transporter permease [Ostreibacterium sp.]
MIERIRYILHDNPTLIPIFILLSSFIVFGLIIGQRFFNPFNISLILQQVSIIGLLAAAQALIILTAGIDLSIGAIMVLISVVIGKLAVENGVPAPLALLIGLMLGVACQGLNGLLVTRLKLPPFIVTLGTWSIFLAINRLISHSHSIRSQDIDKIAPLFKWFGSGFYVLGAKFTFGSILMFLIFIILWYILNKTAWGRHVYAVGDDIDAAELSGIRTNRQILSVYILAGLIAAIAAWSSIGRVGSIVPNAFSEINLHSITAVVIGGVSLFGGRGSIFGPLFGALTVGVFEAGLRQSGLDVQWQVFTIGWLIIIAVSIDQWVRKVAK